MAAIEFDHVTKQFADGTIAVDDLSLTVEDGEFMIFVGPSGCGKTTALRMVAGLETITDGEIRIGDRRVNDVDPPDSPMKSASTSDARGLFGEWSAGTMRSTAGAFVVLT